MNILAVVGLLAIGWLIGWTHAHVTVAQECHRLGAFFVGKTTYRCTAIEPIPSEPLKESPNE